MRRHEKAAFEPFADGLIVEFETGVRDHDAHDKEQHTHYRSIGCRDFVARDPSGVDVDQRVMRDVKRIGDISEESAKPGGELSGNASAGSHSDDDREKNDDAERFIQSIHPEMLGASDSGSGKDNDDEKAAYGERSLNVKSLTYAHEQHASEEWIQQASEADVELRLVYSPSANDIATGPEDSKVNQQACR